MATLFAGLARLSARTEVPLQVAAVCYRMEGESVEFLLVNTTSGKWTFPKGRIDPGLSPSENAATEAWEEAGARGRISDKHFGFYIDTKRTLRHTAQSREVRIATFLLEVQSTVTPRESGRNPSWFSACDARKKLAEGRSSRNAKQIAQIVDTAVEHLTSKSKRRLPLLVRSRSRSFAPAR